MGTRGGASRGASPSSYALALKLAACNAGLFTNAKRSVSVEEASAPGGVPTLRYRRGAGGAPIIVLHGLSMAGNRHRTLDDFARSLAVCGFTAIAPNLPALSELDFRADDVAVIESAVADASSAGRVGLMGFSFSAGYALLAASKPRTARRVSFVLAAGSYYSLPRLLASSLSSDQRDPYPRMALAYQARGALGLSADDDAAYGELMRDYCQREDRFSESDKRLISLVATDEMARGARAHWSTRTEEARALDLESGDALERIAQPVFLMHAEGDSLIPWRDTARIRRRLVAAGRRPRTHIADRGGHLAYANGSQLGLLNFIADLISVARRG